MGLTKKAEKWAYAVGFPRDPSAWEYADAAPFKEFIAKLLSAELTKNTPDLVASEPIPFEKVGFRSLIVICLVIVNCPTQTRNSFLFGGR